VLLLTHTPCGSYNQLGPAGGAALAAAFLSERDPFLRSMEGRFQAVPHTRSDLLDRIDAIEAFEKHGTTRTPFGELNRASAKVILRARDQFLRSMRQSQSTGSPRDESLTQDAMEDAFLQALLAAYPDRIARRREPGSGKALMAGSRGVRLGQMSGVGDAELFLCLDVDAQQVPGQAQGVRVHARRQFVGRERCAGNDRARIRHQSGLELFDTIWSESEIGIADHRDVRAHEREEAVDSFSEAEILSVAMQLGPGLFEQRVRRRCSRSVVPDADRRRTKRLRAQ